MPQKEQRTGFFGASMGAFLLSSGTKGKRLALPNAEIMIHQPSAGTKGQVTDMAIHLRRLEIIKKRLNSILADQTGCAYNGCIRPPPGTPWRCPDR